MDKERQQIELEMLLTLLRQRKKKVRTNRVRYKQII